MTRIAFSDFWPGFNPRENLFQQTLEKRFNACIVENPSKADILIYSVFGHTFQSFDGLRIFYTGESVIPRWEECDAALSYLKDGTVPEHRHFRLPCWMLNRDVPAVDGIERYSREPENIMQRHLKFCNFVYSNGAAEERIRFFNALSKYKKVDSGGRLLNNIGTTVKNKIEFCSQYKFTIAFENYAAKGYLTEKLFHGLAAGSLPIYWGDPDVGQEVNLKRIIHARDFHCFENLVDHIVQLDQDHELYLSYFRENIFLPGQKGIKEYKDGLAAFLEQTIRNGIQRKPEDKKEPHGPLSRYGYAMMPGSTKNENANNR